jgi:hypothetical protein
MLVLRANLLLLCLLGFTWLGLRTTSATAAQPELAPLERAELSLLEDAFAREPSDVRLARQVTERYLAVGHPALAIAAVKAAHPELLEDAVLLHRLASAYEKTGRVRDAFVTSGLALSRCARSLGTHEAVSVSPIPRYLCAEHNYVALDQHREALGRMMRWGVSDPEHDPRARLAYRMAARVVRVEMASAE